MREAREGFAAPLSAARGLLPARKAPDTPANPLRTSPSPGSTAIDLADDPAYLFRVHRFVKGYHIVACITAVVGAEHSDLECVDPVVCPFKDAKVKGGPHGA